MERLGTGNHAIYPWRSLIGIGILNDFEGNGGKGKTWARAAKKPGDMTEKMFLFSSRHLL
jgi:hypothetical protein